MDLKALTMLPKINTPCPENWDKMKIGLRGRFCEKCEFEVVDFTKMSRAEVITYLYHNRNQRICGRLGSKQLDHHQDMLISIRAVLKKNKNSSMAFYLLTVGSLILMQCEEPTIQKQRGESERTEISLDDASSETEIWDEDFEAMEVGIVLFGDVVLDEWDSVSVDFEDPLSDPNAPRIIVDKMPEFPGGIETFYKFFTDSLNYPEQAKRMGIQGRVYIEFIVTPSGETSEVKVVKGVVDILDDEAVRVFKMLPKWIPGKDNGFPVPVKMVMPVSFSLD